MKKISIALAAVAMISFVACTNNETTGEETPVADTTMPTEEPAPIVDTTATMPTEGAVEGAVKGAADAATGAVKDAATGAVDAAADAAKKAVK